MEFKDYTVGLITSRAGMNAVQLVEVKRRLSFIGNLIPPEGKIRLQVLGVTNDKPHFGIGVEITNLIYVAKVVVTIIAGSRNGKPVDDTLMDRLKTFDEVWCVTGPGQDTALSRVKVAKIYQAGTADPKRATIFKLIPAWWMLAPSAGDTPKKVKKSKQQFYRS